MDKKRKNILIISPNKSSYSETFIKCQIDNLKGNIYVAYGGYFPRFYGDGESMARNNSIFNRIRAFLLNNKNFLPERGFINYLRENKIDIVLAQYGLTGANVYTVLKKLKIPLIVHFHGFDAYQNEVLADYHVKYKEMFDYAEKIIAVSRHMYSQLVSLGAPEHKLMLNHYGPNPLFSELNPDYTSCRIIFAGRFVDKKAPYYTILAFNELAKQIPGIKLTMVGDGPLLESAINLCRHLKIEQRVEFPGVLTPETLCKYYENSFLYVQHSITTLQGNSEGTPNTILEAAAAGLPIVSTNHAGIPDVVVHEKSGFLVEQHDVSGMAERMIYLCMNRDKARLFGEFNKVRIRESFTMAQYIHKLQEILDR